MPNNGSCYRFEDFVLDVSEHRLTGAGRDVYLPPKTFETLLFLVSRSGRLTTKKELLDALWPNVAVTENALTRCIKEVREALGDDARHPRFIETVARLGYRFIAEVECIAPAGPECVQDENVEYAVPLEFEGPGSAAAERESIDNREAGELHGAAVTAVFPDRRPGIPRWARRIIVGASILAVALPLTGIFYLADYRSSSLSFGPHDFILITDFDNQAGDPLFDRSLNTAFTLLMEQSAHASPFPRSRVIDTLRRMGRATDLNVDEELGREICLRENIRGLVSVSIVNLGKQYALSAKLLNPQNGNTVRKAVEYAQDQDHILPALQSLATKVRGVIGESLSSIEKNNHELLQVTTSSLKALKFFSEGVAAWERGQYDQAIKLYRYAIQEDPDFAKAHAALGAAYCSHRYSNQALGKEHFDKALLLSGRTTERERLSIQISYEQGFGHSDTARALYKIYLQTYPDDFRARYNFGNLLKDNDQLEEAVRQFDEALRLAPNYAGAFINLATCYSRLGKPSEALENYARAFKLEPSWMNIANLNHEYGFALVKSGSAAKARDVFTQALSTDIRAQALRSLALLDLYEGKYRHAGRQLEEAIRLCAATKQALAEARNHQILAILFEGQGNEAGAMGELDKEVKCLQPWNAPAWMWIRIGIGYARAGAIGKAVQILESAKKKSDTENFEQASDLLRLEGELELARGHHRGAVSLLLLADNKYRTSFTVEGLAHAYRISADSKNAIASYECLLEMKHKSLGFEPQQDWISAHYWLACLYASRGDGLKAKELLDSLLIAWKEADSDLPLLQKANLLAAEVSGQNLTAAK